jgi:hypothetical protein
VIAWRREERWRRDGGEEPEQEIAGRPLGDLGSGSFYFNRFGREKIK